MGTSKHIAVLCIAACLTAGAATLARADDTPTLLTVPDDPGSTLPNPYAAGEQAIKASREDGTAPVPDTDFTPDSSKAAPGWMVREGARFGEDHVSADSVTSFSDDLVTVAFPKGRTNIGYAGGSTCAVEPHRQEGEPDSAFEKRVLACADASGMPGNRVPVLYRYTRDADHPSGLWQKVHLPGGEEPGYIGAIGWDAATGEVMAVGGTGTYPKREPASGTKGWTGSYGAANAPARDCDLLPATGDVMPQGYGYSCDEAGQARAWLSHDGEWRELTDDLQAKFPGLHGLNALDCSISQLNDLCFAGGLARIIRWEKGSFRKVYATDSACFSATRNALSLAEPKCGDTNDALFVFRVRQFRFAPDGTDRAYAVTDGCCAEAPHNDVPRVLGWNRADGQGDAWWVRDYDPTIDYCRNGAGGVLCPGPYGIGNGPGARPTTRPEMPDSIYSFSIGRWGGSGYRVGLVLSPGGVASAERPAERPSVVSEPYCLGPDAGQPGLTGPQQVYEPDIAFEALRGNLSTARLLAGDGDIAQSFDGWSGNRGGPSDIHEAGIGGDVGCLNHQADLYTGGDAVPDWAVGELRSTDAGLGARALLLGTATRPARTPDTINEPQAADLTSGSYAPTDQKRLTAYLRSQYFGLDTYSLNAINVIDPFGIGWAVGLHGAIARLGDDSNTSGTGGGPSSEIEPAPPTLGTRRPAQLPSAAAYESKLPATKGPTASVPALASQPMLHLPSPRLVSYGSPNPAIESRDIIDWSSGPEDVRQIVMSRDGSEGWALGGQATAYHYDGEKWTRCDPEGIQAIRIEPDPACASLAPLLRYVSGNGRPAPVAITAAARIPYEANDDPADDDRFEVLAIGAPYRERPGDPERPAVIRYVDGRWHREAGFPFSQPSQLYFTAPGDAWALSSGSLNSQTRLYHLAMGHWTDCGATPEPTDCEDPQGLLKLHDSTNGTDQIAGVVGAGDRVYAYGYRKRPGKTFPMVLVHANGHWTIDPALGGFDPATEAARQATDPPGDEQGRVDSLAVARLSSGAYAGWAFGRFQIATNATVGVAADLDEKLATLPPKTTIMRLSESGWVPFDDSGPVHDYLGPPADESSDQNSHKASTNSAHQIVIPGPGGTARAYMVDMSCDGICPPGGHLFTFDDRRGHWRLAEQEPPPGGGLPNVQGFPGDGLIAPDNQGGLWMVSEHVGIDGTPHFDFLRYTDRVPAPVFQEAPNPLRDRDAYVTSLAAGPDGTVWLATKSSTLYRYDRALGWSKVEIPGWDAKLATVGGPAPVYGLALGPDGRGVAVGARGRIADIAHDTVQLDRAAGIVCDAARIQPPCGTGRDLRTAAVSSDGSGATMAGGERMSLLWRPTGTDDFRALPLSERPPAPPSSQITGIALPRPDRAFLTTDSAAIYAGTLTGGHWSWTRESVDAQDKPLTLDRDGFDTDPLRAIAIDSSLEGYAVGDRGVILRRTGDGDHPWVRVETPFLDELTSVALPAGGGRGVLVGGESGLILTGRGDHFEIARPADSSNSSTGRIVGLATLPADRPDSTEAWAATSAYDTGSFSGGGSLFAPSRSVSRLLHYASNPSDPLLSSGSRANALPDTPPARSGELSFAPFGKTDCRQAQNQACPAMEPSLREDGLTARMAVDEIGAAARAPGGPALAVFTGDISDSGGTPGVEQIDANEPLTSQGVPIAGDVALNGAFDPPAKRRRWRELIGERLEDAGVPMYGALGSNDLANPPICYGTSNSLCTPTQQAKAADSSGWRNAFASAPSPWGGSEALHANGYSFAPVGDTDIHTPVGDAPGQVAPNDPQIDNPGIDTPVGSGPDKVKAPIGGARTHYAFDVFHDGSDTPAARFVFVDTSQGSMSGADTAQRPFELSGGQTAWLKQMLCRPSDEANTGDSGCTRTEHEPAVVVSSTPTYTYASIPPTETQSDAAAFEALLFRYDVSAVVSGHLGWNGLYYALASGVHLPQPGGAYPDSPPPSLPGQAEPIPFAVASSAGGGFGGDGTASQGFWHGYSVVRVPADGDPSQVIVEQRPILDWVGILGSAHDLRPGQKVDLHGAGREPLGYISPPTGNLWERVDTRYDDIDSAAITHRYDLVLADTNQPWLPLRLEDATEQQIAAAGDGTGNRCAPYVCIPETVGTIDESGQVRAGSGGQARTFSLAVLSVGAHSATYPVVFEPRPSFKLPPPPPQTPQPPAPSLPAPPTAPPPPPAPSFTSPPVIPPPPAVPPTTPASPIAPPPPPPAPPASIDLFTSPAQISVPPLLALFPPAAPVINVAPPTPARPVEKAKKVAVQSSGSDSDAKDSKASDAAGDLAQAPRGANGAQMTRHSDPNAFTAIAHRDQASAWARDLQWGGGLTLMALVAAFGWITVRPTPRRREPEVPAPAFSRQRRR